MVSPAGAQGPAGLPGAPGPQGLQGVQGLKGDKGDPCLPSNAACVGPQGLKGDKGDKGDQGDQGVAGNPGLGWRGAWDVSATYASGDAVSYDGSAYISLVNAPDDVAPPTDPGEWQLLAQRGAQGVPGEQGPPGSTGVSGWQQIETDVTLVGGAYIQKILTCPVGKTAIGGGYTDGWPNVRIADNGPSECDPGWQITASNGDTATHIVAEYLICAFTN